MTETSLTRSWICSSLFLLRSNGMGGVLIPLSDVQQKFADQNHGLLLKFLSDNELDEDYYSILVERYLKTVVKYLESEDLQEYAFSTVLWRNLRSELFNYRRKVQDDLTECIYDDRGVPADEDRPLDSALWARIEEVLTRKQLETVMLRNQGFSNQEIGKACKVSKKAIEKRFQRIRKTIRRYVL